MPRFPKMWHIPAGPTAVVDMTAFRYYDTNMVIDFDFLKLCLSGG